MTLTEEAIRKGLVEGVDIGRERSCSLALVKAAWPRWQHRLRWQKS